MLSEEEKNAIEYLKARLYGNEGCELIDVAQSDLRIIIKLADRVLKDDKNWQEIYDDQEENIREKNNKICEFEFIIENQQKELNNLKEIEKSHQEENGKLRVELEEEKEKNKELQKYEEAYKLLSYGLNNYISKDKIKAEMEDIIDYFEYANATSEDMEFLEKKKKEILEEK